MENSTGSTGWTKCSTMLLKADTGADVNLMNRQTFDQLFGKAKDVLQLTPIRMENYGNTAVKVLGMFHAFLRWKDKVCKQLFYITDCDRSPNLLSRDAFYHTWCSQTLLYCGKFQRFHRFYSVTSDTQPCIKQR